MEQAGLRITLSAEVDQAIRSLNNVNDQFERMGTEAAEALQSAERALNDLGSGTVSINRLSQALNVFRQASLAATDPASLQRYNRNIQLLETEIANLSRAGRTMAGAVGTNSGGAGYALQNLGRVASDAPFGFIAIQNNLDPLIQSFGQLRQTAGSNTAALKLLAGSLMGPAGIGLAFTAVTAITTSLIKQYGSLGNAYDALFGQLSAGKVIQDAYTKAIADSVGAVEGEMSRLRGLIAVAKDENVSRDQRLRAVQLIQKEYPDYLSNLSLENINSRKTTESIERMSEALIRQARVRGAQDLIAKQQAKIFEAQNKDIKEQAPLLQKATTALAKFLVVSNTATVEFDALQVAAGWEERNKVIGEAETNIKSLQTTIDDLLKTDAKQGTLGIGEKFDKAAKSGKTASDVLKDLAKAMAVIDAQSQQAGNSIGEITTARVKALQNAFEGLIKMGLAPASPALKAISDQINSLGESINLQGLSSAVPTAITDGVRTLKEGPALLSAEDLKKILGVSTGTALEIPVSVSPVVLPTVDISSGLVKGLDQAGADFKARLEERKAQMSTEVAGFTKDINLIVQESTLNGIGSLAEGIGKALGKGGGLQDVFASFVNVIADFGAKLGKQLIVQGFALEAFKTSLASFQGYGAIAAGAALIAASAAFKSLASGGINSYATGGIVTSPQLALIGDNPGRKEAVVPSEMFDKIGNGMGDMVLTTKIKGNDLYVLVQRAGREFNRFN